MRVQEEALDWVKSRRESEEEDSTTHQRRDDRRGRPG